MEYKHIRYHAWDDILLQGSKAHLIGSTLICWMVAILIAVPPGADFTKRFTQTTHHEHCLLSPQHHPAYTNKYFNRSIKNTYYKSVFFLLLLLLGDLWKFWFDYFILYKPFVLQKFDFNPRFSFWLILFKIQSMFFFYQEWMNFINSYNIWIFLF